MTGEDITLPFVEVLDALTCGVAVVDRVGRIEYANPRLAEMMGRAPTELPGQTLRRICATANPTDLERVLTTLGTGVEREFHLPMAGGAHRPVILAGRLLPGTTNDAARFVVTVQDITIHKAQAAEAREQFEEVATLTDTVMTKALRLEDYSRELEEAVRQRTADLHEANLEAITMLAVASEAKDADTGAHVLRIRKYAEAVARWLGLNDVEVIRIGYSAILHDVGKMQVPDAILKKPGILTEEERSAVEQHTLAGERILSKAPFFAGARQVARSHHENWDGSGYPDRLRGDAIPLPARIVRVVDTYDGLIARRPYKAPWPAAQSLEYIRENSGRLFDPRVVQAFLTAHAAGEIQGGG